MAQFCPPSWPHCQRTESVPEDAQDSSWRVHFQSRSDSGPSFIDFIALGVCVVAGKFCGRRGKLLEKYKSNDTASIQLNDDFEAHILPLDCIAEYAGAMDAEDD